MEWLAITLMIYFFIGAGVCLLICVNSNNPGILGKLKRLVFKTIPTVFTAVVKRLFGERVLNFLGGIKYYLMETNHPVVQIFYLLISVGGFIAYEIQGIFKFMPNDSIGDFHVILANLLAMICFWTYYKSCAVEAGEVNKSTVDYYSKKYESYYDQVLYKKNNKCTTCKTVKPARSKHCSICRRCVSKYDHHCVWVRQCVGQKNYKYFVSFLFLHGIWCLYLSVIGTISLISYLNKISFWKMSFRMDNEIVRASNMIAIQYLLMSETIFFFLIIMCAIMGTTLIIFVFYHFFLIAAGQTTNERIKKSDETDMMKKEVRRLTDYEAKIRDSEGKLPEQIPMRDGPIPKNEFLEYAEECKQRLAILLKPRHNPGFIGNLKQIFSD